MPTIQMRNVPTELYDKLVRNAENSRRSLTQEVIVLLTKALDLDESADKQQKRDALNTLKADRKTEPAAPETVEQWVREMRDER